MVDSRVGASERLSRREENRADSLMPLGGRDKGKERNIVNADKINTVRIADEVSKY
jgi:hypothetical protein